MANEIYTRLLGSGRSTTSSPIVLFTVPSTGVYVVRDIVVTNLDSSAAVLQVYYGTGGINLTLLRRATAAAGESYHWDGRQVLPPGAVLTSLTTGMVHTVVVTGYMFKD